MITCIIRYHIDPSKKAEFEQYARNWGQAIPRCGGDLASFLPSPMVAPQIIIVNGFEAGIDRNNTRSSGVQRDSFNRLAVDPSAFDGPAHRLGQGAHVVGMALGGVIGIFLLPQQRIVGYASAQSSTNAVED